MSGAIVGLVLPLAVGVLLAVSAPAGADLVVRSGDLRVIVGEKASIPEQRAAELLAAEVKRRTGLEVPVGSAASARYSLLVGTTQSGKVFAAYAKGHAEIASLAEDGYHLATEAGADGQLVVLGQSPSGVMAGVGRLLRLMRYGPGSLAVPAVTVTDAPRLPVRGIYFATHFGNFYHVAPLEEVDRVIEDFALWGGNSLSVWFDMHHFRDFSDPAAQKHLARLKHFGETAKSLGLHFGLTMIANEGYGDSPKELREQGAPAGYGCEICPSKPEGLALIGKCQAEVIDAFPQVDFVWTWPYDQGACWCDQCKPWGGNGFLRASEQLARLYHERFPQGQVWVSTWLFESFPGAGDEYGGLFRAMREGRATWCTGILAGTHGDVIPPKLDTRPAPERFPLTCFPEISMYQMGPWGGCGANPLPGFCTHLAENMRGKIVGGWPYSEGIYEDLNKWFWVQTFWQPGRATDDILAEYASYYLSPDVVPDAVRLFHLLEATHARNGWHVRNLAQAEEAWSVAQSVDARLPAWAKTSWRWRLICVRAQIDHVLKTQGAASAEGQAALKPLADEIIRIYHADDTFIRPAAFPAPRDVGNLAFGRPVTVSSTHPDCPGSEGTLTNGVFSQDDSQDFWAQDPTKDKTPQVTLDLGAVKPIKEVRLQFRGLYGTFWFIPTTITFEGSSDNQQFERVLVSDKVPKEGAPYSPDLWTYPLNRPARYLRLTLGASQHTGDQYAGIVELTEIEAY